MGNPALDFLALDNEAASDFRIAGDGEISEGTSVLLVRLCLRMNDAVLRIALWLRLRFIVFRHHLHELILQRIQPLAGRRGDNEDGPAEFLLEVILNELRQLLRFWDIRFIENNNARALAKIAKTGVFLESFLILSQLVF